jgi:hypothetical protein
MYFDPSGKIAITLSTILVAALIGATAGAAVGGIYCGMASVASGESFWKGFGIGVLTGAFIGAGAGIAGVFIAPALAGTAITMGGVALGKGVALGIGAGIAFCSGFIGGMGADLWFQSTTGSDLNWGQAALAGLQWGLLNTVNAFTVGLAGPLEGFAAPFVLSLFGNIMYGTLGLLFDIVRTNPISVPTRKMHFRS